MQLSYLPPARNPGAFPQFSSVATLGNPRTSVTCSTFVARNFFPGSRIVGAASFEDAATRMRDGEADALLVPAAYPMLRAFLMDDTLELACAVIHPIPALVATAVDNGTGRYRRLYYHPATESLIGKIACFTYDEAVPVSSNEVAVEEMLKDVGAYAALTNELVTAYHSLPVLQVMRARRGMAWVLFIRAS